MRKNCTYKSFHWFSVIPSYFGPCDCILSGIKKGFFLKPDPPPRLANFGKMHFYNALPLNPTGRYFTPSGEAFQGIFTSTTWSLSGALCGFGSCRRTLPPLDFRTSRGSKNATVINGKSGAARLNASASPFWASAEPRPRDT